MKYLYRLYQLVVALPLFLLTSILVSLVTVVGSIIGNGHFWGYYPGKLWAWLTVRLFLLPVTVKGRENLKPGQSYVFVSNHQGAFDIFLIYGFLNRNFKWMMKHQLRKVPFIGIACEYSHQIFVDKRGPRKIKETYDKAEKPCMAVCRWWYSRKAHVALLATWEYSSVALLCLPTSCSCLWCH